MSLFLDIGQGAGLAGAAGVRPYLPPLLAGALAREDVGIDFDGTHFEFLESPTFLFAVLAFAVAAYVAERGRRASPQAGTDPAEVALVAIGLGLGALLFAGSLAEGHDEGSASWLGLLAGVACSALGYAAVATIFRRARSRLQPGGSGLLDTYADALSLALAGLSILLPPVGIVAVVAFVVLLARSRGGGGRKYEGLRVLR